MKKGKYKSRKTCRLCNSSNLELFLDLGWMPLAGNYLKENDVGKESYYPLRVFFCQNCFLVQLIDIVAPDILFRDYRYLSSVGLSDHFSAYAHEVFKRFLTNKSFVVEIGSNDGVLLIPLQKLGAKVLGVDPALNVAKIASAKGVETLTDFFTKHNAFEIVKRYGRADAIFANNVLAHIDNMQDVAEGVSHLLKPSGVFVFEVHYVLDLLEKLQYDFIYPGEHLAYYSLLSITNFWEKYGFSIFDVKRIPAHAGSLRVYMQKKRTKPKSTTSHIEKLILHEKEANLNTIYPYRSFASKINEHRKKLKSFLLNLKKRNKRVVGYGAAGRGNALLFVCDITSDIVEYVVDESFERIGRFTPGSHVPIVGPEVFRSDNPDYVLLLAWSYKDKILEKEEEFLKKKGRFILPLPSIEVISR